MGATSQHCRTGWGQVNSYFVLLLGMVNAASQRVVRLSEMSEFMTVFLPLAAMFASIACGIELAER